MFAGRQVGSGDNPDFGAQEGAAIARLQGVGSFIGVNLPTVGDLQFTEPLKVPIALKRRVGEEVARGGRGGRRGGRWGGSRCGGRRRRRRGDGSGRDWRGDPTGHLQHLPHRNQIHIGNVVGFHQARHCHAILGGNFRKRVSRLHGMGSAACRGCCGRRRGGGCRSLALRNNQFLPRTNHIGVFDIICGDNFGDSRAKFGRNLAQSVPRLNNISGIRRNRSDHEGAHKEDKEENTFDHLLNHPVQKFSLNGNPSLNHSARFITQTKQSSTDSHFHTRRDRIVPSSFAPSSPVPHRPSFFHALAFSSPPLALLCAAG